MNRRVALFLLPRSLDQFILADFVRPLAESDGVSVVEPGRVPAGALMRLPGPVANAEATRQAARVKPNGEVAVIIVMHPVLEPLASALLKTHPNAELWFGIWDRYDHAPDADAATRAKVAALHERLAKRADWIFTVTDALAQIERAAGREADVLPPPHDRFPSPDPNKAVFAATMGHLGRRTDWGLLASLLEAMPELTLLLIGEMHPDETPDDEAMKRVQKAPGAVVLGSLTDEAAARVISAADVCLLPFRVDEFNDAGLPQRILKSAKLGRRTLVPPLAGPLTQAQAVTVCNNLEEWTSALRNAAPKGRHDAEPQLRDWALSQNEQLLLEPIRARLRALGVES